MAKIAVSPSHIYLKYLPKSDHFKNLFRIPRVI